jgi:cytochrome c553
MLLSNGPPAATEGLAWAYPRGTTTAFKPMPPREMVRIPGSKRVFTGAQLADDYAPVDWFPADHPPPPAIVARDPKRRSTPCASCHFYNGRGFPGSADLAGLPAAYIAEQVKAFRDGSRRSAQADRDDTLEMVKVAKAASDADIALAARYFAALSRRQIARVVETATVPRTFPDKYGWLNLAPGGGREPIGMRVVEVSEDLGRMFKSDDHVGLIDYVPIGAIARGRAIVMSGGGAKQPCAMCHGAKLGGAGAIPPLAGRPAAYLARAIWDIRSGARGGPSVALMQAPSRGLTTAQIVDVTAYLASLAP